jgi:hypothetical protein
VIRPKSAPRRVGSQRKYKKPRSGIGAFFSDFASSRGWSERASGSSVAPPLNSKEAFERRLDAVLQLQQVGASLANANVSLRDDDISERGR